MRIGIDIDNTLTDVQEDIVKALFSYAKSLGKEVNINLKAISDANNDGRAYQDIFKLSYDELKYFLGTVQESITNNAVPRKSCVETLLKLHTDGNEIFIITARDSEFHEEPYLQSKLWLDKHSIYYDKLIVNARDKKSCCLENNIDLLIDDSESNCSKVFSGGIPVIRIGQKNKKNEPYVSLPNWQQIYKYICEKFY